MSGNDRKFGVPTESQLEKINQLAKRPLSKEEVFVFPDKLVGDMIIPERYIQIHKSLLNVFKEDAKEGVSLLIDHPWAGLFAKPKAAIGYGRTFDSKLKRSDVEGEDWALYADHYIVRGKEIDGIKTDSIIASIEDGTFFDTSIGWGADTYECSICGNNYMDYGKCNHFAGREYDGKLCHVIAKPPGFLMENSIVFDGAYPGAGVLSAAGDVPESKMVIVDDLKGLSSGTPLLHTYSSRCGKLITFARKEDLEKKVVLNGINLSKGGEKTVSNKVILDGVDVTNFVTDIVNDGSSLSIALNKESLHELPAIKEMLSKLGEGNSGEQVEPFITLEQAKEALGREVTAEELLAFAKEGDNYLQALIKEAEEWGIRAHGDQYNKDSWNTRYKFMNSAELKGIIETFKTEAESAISTGRQSAPDAALGGDTETEVPDDAYKV